MNPPTLVTGPVCVETTTSFEPAVPSGVTAVITEAETNTTSLAATPPTVTALLPDKFVPLMVIAVPPDVRPIVGLIPLMVGTEKSTYVNALACVMGPLGVLTTTSRAAPSTPGGEIATMDVADATTNVGHATPPIETPVAPSKFAPEMVTALPPSDVPEFGAMALMDGRVELSV